jgi:hypothetical protein
LPLRTKALCATLALWLVLSVALTLTAYALFAFRSGRSATDSGSTAGTASDAGDGGGGGGDPTASDGIAAVTAPTYDASECTDSRTALFGSVSQGVQIAALFACALVALRVRNIPLHFGESKVLLYITCMLSIRKDEDGMSITHHWLLLCDVLCALCCMDASGSEFISVDRL